MTPNAIRANLERACKAAGSQAQFAREHGLTEQFLSQVINGRKSSYSPAILAALGLERAVVVRVRRNSK